MTPPPNGADSARIVSPNHLTSPSSLAGVDRVGNSHNSSRLAPGSGGAVDSALFWLVYGLAFLMSLPIAWFNFILHPWFSMATPEEALSWNPCLLALLIMDEVRKNV